MEVLRHRRVVGVELETALHYGRIAAHLRQQKLLSGRSHNNLWIAATARCHGAKILTHNVADFALIPGLEVLGYGD